MVVYYGLDEAAPLVILPPIWLHYEGSDADTTSIADPIRAS
jgi:hypothetical protein